MCVYARVYVRQQTEEAATSVKRSRLQLSERDQGRVVWSTAPKPQTGVRIKNHTRVL